MRLRDDGRLKEKMEFYLETRHVLYLILWSIVLSGVIFYTGMFIGKKGIEDQKSLAAENPLKRKAVKKDDLVDPMVSTFEFLTRLTSHPEKRELQDAVLNAMEKLRQETQERLAKEALEEEKELAKKLFPTSKAQAPDELLKETAGIGPRKPEERQARLGIAPDLLVPGPEEEVVTKAGPPGSAHKEAEPKQRIPDDPSKVVASSRGTGSGYFGIQAKAFRDKEDAKFFADYLKQELGRSKYQPFVMPVELPGKGKWYRVRIGKFATRLEAKKFKDEFEKKLGLETFLVNL